MGPCSGKYRRAAGLTQEALAERVGLTAQAISALERGFRRWPHPSTALRGAQVLTSVAAMQEVRILSIQQGLCSIRCTQYVVI